MEVGRRHCDALNRLRTPLLTVVRVLLRCKVRHKLVPEVGQRCPGRVGARRRIAHGLQQALDPGAVLPALGLVLVPGVLRRHAARSTTQPVASPLTVSNPATIGRDRTHLGERRTRRRTTQESPVSATVGKDARIRTTLVTGWIPVSRRRVSAPKRRPPILAFVSGPQTWVPDSVVSFWGQQFS